MDYISYALLLEELGRYGTSGALEEGLDVPDLAGVLGDGAGAVLTSGGPPCGDRPGLHQENGEDATT